MLSSLAELTADTHRAGGWWSHWFLLGYWAGGSEDSLSRRERPALLPYQPPSDEGSRPRPGPAESAASQGLLTASRDWPMSL